MTPRLRPVVPHAVLTLRWLASTGQQRRTSNPADRYWSSPRAGTSFLSPFPILEGRLMQRHQHETSCLEHPHTPKRAENFGGVSPCNAITAMKRVPEMLLTTDKSVRFWICELYPIYPLSPHEPKDPSVFGAWGLRISDARERSWFDQADSKQPSIRWSRPLL